MVILGVLFGLALAGGIAFLVCTIVLKKSNDFGNTEAGIEQNNGYAPLKIQNKGQERR